MPHQRGPITFTFTADWFLQEGQGRELMGENDTGELPHIPNERLDPQDHEGKRIRQMRPMQGPLDGGRPVKDGEGPSRTNPGSYPTYLRSIISNTHPGEKCLQTIWDETTSEFKDIQYLNLTQETILNVARAREMTRPLTSGEDRRIPKETVVKESFWRMRPDGITVLPPVDNTDGTFCILEHKSMSDVYERYLVRVKSTAENQYVFLRSVISTVIQ
jgi:hypothetical protein